MRVAGKEMIGTAKIIAQGLKNLMKYQGYWLALLVAFCKTNGNCPGISSTWSPADHHRHLRIAVVGDLCWQSQSCAGLYGTVNRGHSGRPC
jgi:hypothetical protein